MAESVGVNALRLLIGGDDWRSGQPIICATAVRGDLALLFLSGLDHLWLSRRLFHVYLPCLHPNGIPYTRNPAPGDAKGESLDSRPETWPDFIATCLIRTHYGVSLSYFIYRAR